MTTAARNIVSIGEGRVRLNDSDLHRAACKAIHEGNHIVFESLPSLVRQIIEHKTWRTYNKANFADYALDETSNGLGINTNQRLWILKCSMDWQGEHIKEWADVLGQVEKMVRLEAVTSKEKTGSTSKFDGNSLEKLAKNGTDQSQMKITYLPSRNKNDDGHIVRLRKNKPEVFKKVASGNMTLLEARKSTGIGVDAHTSLGRTKAYFRRLGAKERREFVAWLRSEGHIE